MIAAPAATLSPRVATYLGQETGTGSASQTFTLSNSGSAPLSVASASLGGIDAAQFGVDADTCSGQIVPVGANCVVQVSFAPSSAGVKAATLSIISNDASSPATAELSGTATGDPIGEAPPAALTPLLPEFPAVPLVPAAPRPTALATQSATHPGWATLKVAVRSAGRLTTTASARIGARTIRIPATVLRITRPGTFGIRLSLPRAVRARLAAVGRLRITITSVLTAAGRRPARSTRSVSLRAPRSRVLRGQWVGRIIGPWSQPPTFTRRGRSGLRFTTLRGRRVAKVVR